MDYSGDYLKKHSEEVGPQDFELGLRTLQMQSNQLYKYTRIVLLEGRLLEIKETKGEDSERYKTIELQIINLIK